MSNYTPGPLTTWVTASQRFDQRGDTAIRKDGQIIGEAYARSSMDQRWPAEVNARLWAAAPELVEALRSYRRECPCVGDADFANQARCELCIAAEAALKAAGLEP